MKFYLPKAMFFYSACLCLILLSSCAQPPPYEENVNIIVSPHKLSVHSGSEDKIFVTLLDKQGGPLFGMSIKATSTSRTVATVTPEEVITNAAGTAMFLIHGISPGGTHIVFSVAGQKASAEVVFIGH